MNAVKATLVKLVLRLCALLPLACARALGRGAAHIYWPFRGRSRRVTERNIQIAFPELTPRDQRRLARLSLCATGELAAEMGHVWLRSPEHISRMIMEVSGERPVLDALQSGRGVIVLAPHLGNWEIIGLHLPSMGSTVSLYEPPHLEALGPMMEAARQCTGATLVPTDSRGIARLVKSVRGGNISGILPDQVPSDINSGQNVPFMGTPCFTGTLASKLIQRTGALAVFGVAERVRGGFSVRYDPVEEAVYSEDMSISLAALNRGIEACVRRCAEQYQWEYKRFRVRPRAGRDLYADV
jgi:KDO2-lipid IV(A) lauroyltransferase